MNHISLAARYRPQTFADVAGQEFITAVLSRAAAENRVAPAYLLSGTRGVGKTTIARIFAKALNCVNAPTAEPCNVCDQCRKITQGGHVDINEIDGASNNGVDDVRQLREHIGYAPMEGRYKVFIVDEAHMLSRAAFNAMLKTLEEPPANVVFIFATTESHKFPVTIISRCQHFVFKHLSELEINAHLRSVLGKEQIKYEEQAVNLIAKRAAGSVRDGMSLLDQTLSLDRNCLTANAVRSVLGLAEAEAFSSLLQHIATKNSAGVVNITRDILNQGIDIGFFLRELSNIWRTLFLLLEAGEKILPTLELSEDEAACRLAEIKNFTPAYAHAAWQMTLEAQRQIIHSPEPGSALELLLLNLTLLPRLIPIGSLPCATESSSAAPANTLSSPEGATTAAKMPTATEAEKKTPKFAEAIKNSASENFSSHIEAEPNTIKQTPSTSIAPTELSISTFMEFYAANAPVSLSPALLGNVQMDIIDQEIVMMVPSTTLYEQIVNSTAVLKDIVSKYSAQKLNIRIVPPTRILKTEAELIAEFDQNEDLVHIKKIMNARILRCVPENI